MCQTQTKFTLWNIALKCRGVTRGSIGIIYVLFYFSVEHHLKYI
jgi:hypothetical protein